MFRSHLVRKNLAWLPLKLYTAFESVIALSFNDVFDAHQAFEKSRTPQIIEPICGTAGSPIRFTDGTMPGFLTTSVQICKTASSLEIVVPLLNHGHGYGRHILWSGMSRLVLQI